MLKYYAFRWMALIVPRIPSGLGYTMAGLWGRAAYRLGRRAKEGARANIRHVLGPDADRKEVEQAVRGMFVEAAKHYVELFRLPRMDLARIPELVKVDHFEYAIQVKERGRGLVIATAHCSNFDVLAQYVAAAGWDLTVPAEQLKPPKLFELIRGLRGCNGLSFLPAGPAVATSLFRILRRGGVVAIAIDRDLNGSGREVRFFDGVTTLPVGALELARRSGAGLIMAFMIRQPDNSFVARVEPLIDLQNTGNRERDLEANLAKVVPLLEQHIRAHPEQWAVFDPVWPS